MERERLRERDRERERERKEKAFVQRPTTVLILTITVFYLPKNFYHYLSLSSILLLF